VSADLTQANGWTELTNITLGPAPFIFPDSAAGPRKNFYRATALP
jgi:hypothetical protein